MRSFIFCLAIVAVSGDAKPWTVAQVANGEHIRNALAEGRGHNVGVITNAAITPTAHAALSYGVPQAVSYAGYPYTYSVPSVYRGKREAEAEPEPYTLAQVAAGQTNGGLLTFVDHGHGTGHRPIVAAGPPAYSVAVPAVASYAGYPYAYYGKRDAEAEPEPYTLAQVAAGQTNGGLLTFVDHGHGTGHRPIVAAPATYTVPAVASYAGYPYTHSYYGKRDAEPKPYTLAQVAAGQTAGGVITSVGGQPVVPFRSIPAPFRTYALHHPYTTYTVAGK